MATGPGDQVQRPVKTAASKRAPEASDEATGDATTLDREIFELLTPSSQAALAHASWLARIGGASRIHMDHLVVGLYRKPDGPTQRLFADARLTTDDLARLLEGIEEAIVPDPPLAVPNLEDPPTISRHVALAFEAARQIAATTPAPDTGRPWIQSRHLLYGVLSVERCTVSRALRRAGVEKDRIPLGPIATSSDASGGVDDVVDDLAAVIAGVRSDEATGPDLLDIGREVDALAKIIAAREVQPPLAIGLFGDWGTGKTFFMRRLQRRIRRIASFQQEQVSGNGTYCREIVQLEFNAWHYIDENLWASLAAAIFDGLDESLTRQGKSRDAVDEDEAKRAKIITGRAAAQHDLAVAEAAKEEADRHVKATEARLEVLDTGSASPTDIVAGAWSAANRDDATKDKADAATASIREVAGKLDLKPDDVTRDLRRGAVGGRLSVALRSWAHGWRTWVPIAVLALLIVVGVSLVAPEVTRLALAIPALIALFPLGSAVRRVWDLFGAAREEYLAIIARDRKAAEEERTAALARAAKAQGEIDAANLRLVDADQQLVALRPKRQLADFVSGRHASADYRSRLGVVAQARDDFEQLTRLIAKAASAPEQGSSNGSNGEAGSADGTFLPSIDRIVLYIDDLDRCREKEVVDVLQAVHLLLAFRLFVVVVAVDPRWLVHSLRVHSKVFGERATASSDGAGEEDEGLEWQTTPLNYLEKIFQVPFAIRPMGETGFSAMIDDLVRTNGDGADAEPRKDGGSAPGGATVVADGGVRVAGDAIDDKGVARSAKTSTDDASTPEPIPGDDDEEEDTTPVDPTPGFLRIADAERLFMAHLHPLVVTPRAAKRFVNVYRILKASIDPKRRATLDQEASQQVVLLMLAMLTSHPAETTPILQALVGAHPPADWWTLVDTVCTDERRLAREAAGKPQPGPDAVEEDDGWKALGEKLAKVRPYLQTTDAALFGEWARDVSRFSFESSRVLLAPVSAPPGEPDAPVGAAHDAGMSPAAT